MMKLFNIQVTSQKIEREVAERSVGEQLGGQEQGQTKTVGGVGWMEPR